MYKFKSHYFVDIQDFLKMKNKLNKEIKLINAIYMLVTNVECGALCINVVCISMYNSYYVSL